jgi:hypothetical protein
MSDNTLDKDVIYPPTAEQIADIKTHNVGLAIRLSSKLGRPLEDWEYEMFRKKTPRKVYDIVELPNERFGLAGQREG